MTAPAAYFSYPRRRPGTDHDRFAHRYLRQAPPVAWPGGARVALSITVDVEHFPMDMGRVPFVPTGGMDRVAPSFWDYTMRDYGNRVGIFRVMRVLDERGLTATAAMNAAIATRYPSLVEDIVGRKWEVMASGLDMKHLHHSGLTREAEAAQVDQAVATLRAATGQAVTGWHSPAHSQSSVTPDLVAAARCRYITDWVNDDMPYLTATEAGPLIALPLTYELSDKRVLFTQNQSLAEWEAQVLAAFTCLDDEADRYGGRLLSLSLAPWIIGQPYRIQALARVLDAIMARGGVWCATGEAVCEAWQAGGGAA